MHFNAIFFELNTKDFAIKLNRFFYPWNYWQIFNVTNLSTMMTYFGFLLPNNHYMRARLTVRKKR